jgi:hypothetical protein
MMIGRFSSAVRDLTSSGELLGEKALTSETNIAH